MLSRNRDFLPRGPFLTPWILSLCRSVWRTGRQGERDGRKHERGMWHISPLRNHGTTISFWRASFFSHWNLLNIPPICVLISAKPLPSKQREERLEERKREEGDGAKSQFQGKNKIGLSKSRTLFYRLVKMRVFSAQYLSHREEKE